MLEIKSPNSTLNKLGPTIFLAGSIEMGTAINWQEKLKLEFIDQRVTFFNPRRDDWDSSWVQSIENKQFSEQVNWELDNIVLADIVVFYFDENTKSPITLMELGYVAGSKPNKVIVCCPEKFWRKGNVDIICQRNNIPVFTTFSELIEKLKELV